MWLEAKEKQDMFVHKKRHAISHDAWLAFSNHGVNFSIDRLAKDQEDLRNFAYHFLTGNYKPHVVVTYKRQAYVGHFIYPFRLTLDHDIHACKWSDFRYNRNIVPVAKGRVVMEVKFSAAMPWWFKDLILRLNLKRQAFSKYVNAVDAINRFNILAK